MEQARHWMHGSSENNSKSANVVGLTNSWDEEAFAEDAARPFGDLIWPPRSYSCSFRGREFRSFQALGGHMNIHRRDRAKLTKQLSKLPQNENLNKKQHKMTSFLSSSPPSSCSDSVSNINRLFSISDSEIEEEDLKKEKSDSHDDIIKPDLSVCLEEAVLRCKKRRVRMDDIISMPLYLRPSKHHLRSKIMHETILCVAAKEDIDLELRLGPKVK